MKLNIFSAEANNIWKKVAGRTTNEQLHFELELYKKLLNFFQVGEYCYYIFNIPLLDLEFVSKEIETLLGYRPSEFSMRTLLDIIHPDDHPYFLNFENKAVQFLQALPIEKLMKFKVRYDFRLQKKDGSYIRILHQSTAIEVDKQGGIIRTLGVHTDITHLKHDGKPVLSFIGLDGEPSYINVDTQKVFAVSKEFLSRRETQILTLLADGRSSKEIAEALYISTLTVEKHRKNMIAKNNCNNTTELVSNAIRKGWI